MAEQKLKKPTRSFTLLKAHVDGIDDFADEDRSVGRYSGATPRSAAAKAASNYLRIMGIPGVVKVEVHIRETTRGGKNKVFSYNVERVINEQTISLGNKPVDFKFRLIVKKKKPM